MFVYTLDDMLRCIGSPLVENGKSVSDKPLYRSEDIKSNIDIHTLNQQFGEAIANFLDGLRRNDGLCCHDKSKEDNMKKYTITECRECKYKVTTKDGEYNPNDIVCRYWMSDGLTEDDYCSRGEDGKYEHNETDICEKPACETCKWGDKYEFDGENWDYMCTIPYSYMTGRVMPRNHACSRWEKNEDE